MTPHGPEAGRHQGHGPGGWAWILQPHGLARSVAFSPPPTLDPHFSYPQSKHTKPDNGRGAPEGLVPTFCGYKPEHSWCSSLHAPAPGPGEGPGAPRALIREGGPGRTWSCQWTHFHPSVVFACIFFMADATGNPSPSAYCQLRVFSSVALKICTATVYLSLAPKTTDPRYHPFLKVMV